MEFQCAWAKSVAVTKKWWVIVIVSRDRRIWVGEFLLAHPFREEGSTTKVLSSSVSQGPSNLWWDRMTKTRLPNQKPSVPVEQRPVLGPVKTQGEKEEAS